MDELQSRLTTGAAEAARRVPGVAFLRPGLAELLRGGPGSGARAGTSGVRVRRGEAPGQWRLEIQLAARRGHRAADVARAVRASVEEAVRELLAAEAAPVSVTVTITDVA
ncbi:Asp23/Gls24 family envelope stress response protein [Phaeacidiphilus oryzae]|uniref:Asp23/Gls24 family envelope stress response protein n=1 Tax=Phaeacidiphilus oryzae TaxID=348818 RepID=UPI000567EFD2|nr:Asp23/Gls24 family envelope stress response protein [Phaeacidiphilus oryzae]